MLAVCYQGPHSGPVSVEGQELTVYMFLSKALRAKASAAKFFFFFFFFFFEWVLFVYSFVCFLVGLFCFAHTHAYLPPVPLVQPPPTSLQLPAM